MNCFFQFECVENTLCFHAEYCNERAVHFLDGTTSMQDLFSATNTASEKDLLLFLNRFSANNDFFAFLQEHKITFNKIKEGYEDTTSDI